MLSVSRVVLNTLVTATWNVNSDIKFVVLLEKYAVMATVSLVWPILVALKTMLTDVFETMSSFEGGRRLSSGNAEAKSQSSSAETLFAGLPVAGATSVVDDDMSKSEEDGVVGMFWVCGGIDFCWVVVEGIEAKGSEGGCGDRGKLGAWKAVIPLGVDVPEGGCEDVKVLNAS